MRSERANINAKRTTHQKLDPPPRPIQPRLHHRRPHIQWRMRVRLIVNPDLKAHNTPDAAGLTFIPDFRLQDAQHGPVQR